MLESRSKKENVIILPNKDRLPAGRIKDVKRYLNMVSVEYGISEDIVYFIIIKEKIGSQLKLQYVPRAVSELHSNDAKKFVLYELVRIGHGCVMKLDEELNKRALVINDLLNTIDDKCRETVTSKLHTVVGTPDELDSLLHELLTDPQFNSFKYTVLNESKTSCLLCVNGDGLFVRSLESPFDVNKQLLWHDITTIKRKANKLIFRKKNGENEELPCINKKTVVAAHSHLLKYLTFINNKESGGNKSGRSSWFGSMALRIRKSLTRRSRPRDSEPQTSVNSPTSKSINTHYRENAPPNSTVPGSSIVSEDCMDNIGSLVEPSIKTNSTHDVSLGSANSFMPGTSIILRTGQDDYMSVKTTSTYEVSLDAVSSPKTLSNHSKSDHDSSSQGLIQAGRSPPLAQTRDNVIFNNKSEVTADIVVPLVNSTPIMCEIQVALQPLGHSSQLQPIKNIEPIQAPHSGKEVLLSPDSTVVSLPDSSKTNISTASGIITSEEDPAMCLDDTKTSVIEDTQMIENTDTMVATATEDNSQVITEVPMMAEKPCILSITEPNDVPSTVIECDITIPDVDTPTLTDIDLPPNYGKVLSQVEEIDYELQAYGRSSIPSPCDIINNEIETQRSSHISSGPSSPSPATHMAKTPSISNKENYNLIIVDRNGSNNNEINSDDTHVNFSRFENEEYVLDSKTIFTSVSTVGDSITKKLTKTEISSVKASGIPEPKQYKTTTIITSTVKKPSDMTKSPVIGVTQSSGNGRMTSNQ